MRPAVRRQMTNLAIIGRCSIVLMVFAAFGFLPTIFYSRPFGSPLFWEDLVSNTLYPGAVGLSIAICLGGGLFLMRRLRGGVMTKLSAFVFMLGFSVVAAFLPPFLVLVSGFSGVGHPPGELYLAMLTICIGLSGFLLFGFSSSFVRPH
jgi:hypothetical protein